MIILLSSFVQSQNEINRNDAKCQTPAELTINIITRYGSDVYKPFRDKFLASNIAKNAGVTNVVFSSVSPSEWISQIQTNNFDVLWGGESYFYDDLADKGLLLPITNENVLSEAEYINLSIANSPLKRFNEICDFSCDNNPVWVASTISTYGFIVNHDVLRSKNLDIPNYWADLAKPAYYSDINPLITISNPNDSLANTRIYESILQMYGWEAGWALIYCYSWKF